VDTFAISLLGGNAWMLLVAFAVGLLLSWWTYRRTVPPTTKAKRRTLIILRGIGLTLLLVALFQPVLTITKTNKAEPKLAIVLDRSKSMQLGNKGTDTSARNSRREAMLKNIAAVFPNEMMRDPEKLAFLSMSDEVLSVENALVLDTFKTPGASTNLSSLFTYLADQGKRLNVEAIALYTDGAYTIGSNPVYQAEQLGIPIFAVGLGDSTEQKDVAISELFVNDLATVGIAQPADVAIRVTGVESGSHVPVTLYGDGEKLGEQIITVRQGVTDYSVPFTFTPKKEGVLKLTARISSNVNEMTTANNARINFVKVLKNTFRIVLIAGAPSPDVSFVRDFFEGRKEVEFFTYIQKQGPEFYEGVIDAQKVGSADLIILIGYPNEVTSTESLALIKRLLVSESRSLLFIPSRQLDIEKLKQIEAALPFTIPSSRISTNEIKVSASVPTDKRSNPIMRSGSLPEEIPTDWEKLTPLVKTETSFQPRSESEVLAEATIQSVKLGQPLIISRKLGRSRQIAFTGYGLWQWKLTSFGRERAFRALSRTKDTQAVKESALEVFLGNATRWLVSREDDKRVRIAPTRKLYDAGERIEFAAQVYDESFLPMDGAIVTARITGASLPQPMEITLEPRSGGRYATTLPQGLQAGDYVYSGEAKRDGKTLGSDGGRFNVGEFSAEFAEPRMRADVLHELADRTGGKFYTTDNAAAILDDIRAHPRFRAREVEDRSDFEGRNAWPLLALAVLFFSIEWFIRKRVGML
jgi:hypothetical protein